MEAQSDTESLLRRVRCTVRPESRFPVPYSEGYSVYGALLDVLDDVDETASQRVHDSPLGSLHNSGLLGSFGDSDRSFHKTVLPREEYTLELGVVDPANADVFQALVNALVLDGDELELSHGTLRVARFESGNTTHEDLLERTGEYDNPTVGIHFRSPTCIEEADEVTTMFPHRGSVFTSLLGKWNATAPEDLELDVDRETIEASVIEKPDAQTYETHSVLVNRVENGDGETRNIFRQGFTGECAYAFKNASDAAENAVTALALFGEYSGVGSAVARGCGNVEVEVR